MLRGRLGLKLDWSCFNKAGSAGNICGKQCKQNSKNLQKQRAETSARLRGRFYFQSRPHASHLRSAPSFPAPLLLRLAAGLLLLARNLHDSVLKTAASVFPLCYPIVAFQWQSQDGEGGGATPPPT